jgi:hypothetical protein
VMRNLSQRLKVPMTLLVAPDHAQAFAEDRASRKA